eukprot:jgi/Mesvir1/17444/Mv08720-RA.2
MITLSNADLKAKTDEFRARIAGGEGLDSLLPEAFAVVREASRRTLKMRHFDVQIMGGAVLHDGRVAEMGTGEGKTLVATLPAYLNALTGKGVHIVTVNDYLAKRDEEWMGTIHRFLGLSVGLIQKEMNPQQRREAYACDITYCSNQELGFDYLRDHTVEAEKFLVLRHPHAFNFAIVDEVDSVLIDEGRNPLLISGQPTGSTEKFNTARRVVDRLEEEVHYTVDRKARSIELTESGMLAAERLLEVDDLWDENNTWAKLIVTAIKAKELYERDVHYIVRDGQAQIVDESTGRVMPSRRWSDNIHQAVEAKEGLAVQMEPITMASVTYQSFFRLFPKLCGMTGTAATEENELWSTYKVDVVVVPPNKPCIRKDFPTVVYLDRPYKWDAVCFVVAETYRMGRPVLVGTTSVESSEILSRDLSKASIPHNLLNARPQNAAREAEIIAQAGRLHAVTISTNMAGRGTDILLGGNPTYLAKDLMRTAMLEYADNPAKYLLMERQDRKSLFLSPRAKGLLNRALAGARVVLHNFPRQDWPNHVEAVLDMSLTMAAEIARTPGGPKPQPQDAFDDLAELLAAAYDAVLEDCEAECRLEAQEVVRLGGLHVIGTELHVSRRIDNQLRGRAGRQGDPGTTIFMISLRDEFLSTYAPSMVVDTLMQSLMIEPEMPLEFGFLNAQLEKQQQLVEEYYAAGRKDVEKFDTVLEGHRSHIYHLRERLLLGDRWEVRRLLLRFMEACVDEIVSVYTNPNKPPKEWPLDRMIIQLRGLTFDQDRVFSTKVSDEGILAALELPDGKSGADGSSPRLEAMKRLNPFPPLSLHAVAFARQRAKARYEKPLNSSGRWAGAVELVRALVAETVVGMYENRVAELRTQKGMDQRAVENVEKLLGIRAVDAFWQDHLANMATMRSSVSMRAYGQLEPLEEYKIEGCRAFLAMLTGLRTQAVQWLFEYGFNDNDDAETSPKDQQEAPAEARVGLPADDALPEHLSPREGLFREEDAEADEAARKFEMERAGTRGSGDADRKGARAIVDAQVED